jgi:hypothetical protein
MFYIDPIQIQAILGKRGHAEEKLLMGEGW